MRFNQFFAALMVLAAMVIPAVADEVDDLILDLKYGTEVVRNDAARILGEIGDQRAVDPLIDALEDENEIWIIRELAAMALGEIGDPRAINPLIDALKDEESLVRTAAAEALDMMVGVAECQWDSYTPDQTAFVGQPGDVFPLRNSPFKAGSYIVLVGPAGEDGLDLPPATWNAFGPYELKGGHKYKAMIESPLGESLRFEEDLADLLSYSDPSPESASVYARNNCPGDVWYAICLRPTKLEGGTAAETEEGEPTLILYIDSLGAVNNEQTAIVYLDLAYKTRITKIQTYHWNYGAGTESPGSILIVDMNSQESDGGYPMTKYEAYGLEGSGGAPNAYWVVEPDLVLEPGLYAIIDSGSSTWAQNDETAGIGVTKVWGYVFSS